MTSLELIKKLILTPGISGYERKIRSIIKDELKKTKGELLQDNLGGVAYGYKGNKSKRKVMFIAHQDEIGFIVSSIKPNGLINLQPIGGWKLTTLKSSPVEIINSKGEHHFGIIGSIPLHHLKDRQPNPLTMESMFVDVGAFSYAEVTKEMGINIGDEVIPVCNYKYLEKNELIIGKAFDDRVGIAGIIELGQYLDSQNHDTDIFCAGSVQEELGARGAITLTNKINPDIAIVLEGPPADDFPGNAYPQTSLGKGMHIRLYDPSMLPKAELKNYIIQLAQKNNIEIQMTVRKGGGTDGKFIHIANLGIPTIVIGVPVRYAHSHNGIMSMKDYRNMMKLAKLISTDLTSEKIENILA